jgi:hypothetical protein
MWIIVLLLRALLALAVVLFLIGLVKAISNARLALSKPRRTEPRPKPGSPPFNPGDIVEGEWKEIEPKP